MCLKRRLRKVKRQRHDRQNSPFPATARGTDRTNHPDPRLPGADADAAAERAAGRADRCAGIYGMGRRDRAGHHRVGPVLAAMGADMTDYTAWADADLELLYNSLVERSTALVNQRMEIVGEQCRRRQAARQFPRVQDSVQWDRDNYAEEMSIGGRNYNPEHGQ